MMRSNFFVIVVNRFDWMNVMFFSLWSFFACFIASGSMSAAVTWAAVSAAFAARMPEPVPMSRTFPFA